MLNPANPLTKTEQRIFEVIGSGIISNKAIGNRLSISQHTVKNHKENIKQKLKLTTCQELLELAVQSKQFSPEEKTEE
ncbi:response regulator transcription factor [Thermoflexibacter ruber]|uniref:Regulatory protein, luxR family n=1 Tax=Thermoflexibacter ruber TaxID=1003 RepID=A0A1I2FX86_9BACT|nr:helix-turn-helix transcriptional regulator [Thermoflexibacter ruber]SFF09418.1 regulatory protein, luxR family [Thermoflexibacter ruber]